MRYRKLRRSVVPVQIRTSPRNSLTRRAVAAALLAALAGVVVPVRAASPPPERPLRVLRGHFLPVTGVAFSPDGRRMVYRRLIWAKNEDQVLIANVDGSSEQVIFRCDARSAGLLTEPSWSANNFIAVGGFEVKKDSITSILVLTPEGKLVKDIPFPLLVWAVAWVPDSSGMFFVGAEKSTGLRMQIWFQPYPAGSPFKISNDLSQYASLSVTADGTSFVSAQQRPAATIYVGDSPSVLNDKIDWKFSPISTEQATGYGLSWTAGGKLLQRDTAWHIYITSADGSGRARLLENDDAVFAPNACGLGDFVVVSRIVDNIPRLFRLNAATGELKQLTFGNDEEKGSCTPDGKWMVYNGTLPTDAVRRVFKVSTDGGAPLELASGTVFNPPVSPDGKLIAYAKIEGQGASAKSKIVIQSTDGGTPLQQIELPADFQQLGWTPDGRALTYVHNTTGSTQNVYAQSLSGGPPVQLTHFNSEPGFVAAYAWSRDGKKFAITRARYSDTDVVLFSGFK